MRGVTPGSTLRLTHEVNMSESMGIGRVWNIVSVGLFVFATTCLVWQSAINPSLPSCGELSITLNGVTMSINAIRLILCVVPRLGLLATPLWRLLAKQNHFLTDESARWSDCRKVALFHVMPEDCQWWFNTLLENERFMACQRTASGGVENMKKTMEAGDKLMIQYAQDKDRTGERVRIVSCDNFEDRASELMGRAQPPSLRQAVLKMACSFIFEPLRM